MADNVDEHSGMSKNSSDSRFLQIDHDEIQHMHLINSASFNTNNDNNNVNEARNENVDNLRQVGGASVNQPSDKNIPDVQSEKRLDNGVVSINLSRTFFTGIGHVLEYIDQVLKIHSF